MRIFLGIFHNFHVSLIYLLKECSGNDGDKVWFSSQLVSAIDLTLLLMCCNLFVGSEAKVYWFQMLAFSTQVRTVQRHSYS